MSRSLEALRNLCGVRVFRANLAALSWLVVAACSTSPIANDAPMSDQVFVMLGALGNLLDFPTDQERLDACVAAKDEKCVGLHARFQDAVRQLFRDGRAEALMRTLTAVDAYCKSPAPASDPAVSEWQSCRGAIVAFYFFPRADEDRRILEHLSALDPAILRNAFIESRGYAGDWVYNRPDRQRWIAFVRSVPILRDEGIANVFTDTKPSTGIGLLAPQVH